MLSRAIFDNGILHGPPHPPAPLPQGGEGRVDFTALAPLGERVARRGVFISRGEKGAPRSACRGGEGVPPVVNSNMGHHTSTGGNLHLYRRENLGLHNLNQKVTDGVRNVLEPVGDPGGNHDHIPLGQMMNFPSLDAGSLPLAGGDQFVPN